MRKPALLSKLGHLLITGVFLIGAAGCAAPADDPANDEDAEATAESALTQGEAERTTIGPGSRLPRTKGRMNGTLFFAYSNFVPSADQARECGLDDTTGSSRASPPAAGMTNSRVEKL